MPYSTSQSCDDGWLQKFAEAPDSVILTKRNFHFLESNFSLRDIFASILISFTAILSFVTYGYVSCFLFLAYFFVQREIVRFDTCRMYKLEMRFRFQDVSIEELGEFRIYMVINIALLSFATWAWPATVLIIWPSMDALVSMFLAFILHIYVIRAYHCIIMDSYTIQEESAGENETGEVSV